MWAWIRNRIFSRNLPAHLESGEWGEAQAERHLASRGCKILGRRVRCGNREEIDIVARDGEVLVFVEVKTRSGELYGSPIEAVNRRKRKLLCKAAARYLARLKNPRVFYRFDVVEVLGSPSMGLVDLRHTPDAFRMDRRYSL